MKTLNSIIGAALCATAVGCSGGTDEEAPKTPETPKIHVVTSASKKQILFTHRLENGREMYSMLIPDTQEAKLLIDGAAKAHGLLYGRNQEDLAVEYMRMDAKDGKFDAVANMPFIQEVAQEIYGRLEAQRSERID